MIVKSYKDFTDLFNGILNDIVFNIKEYEDGNTGTNYYIKPMVLKCFSSKCDLNLGDFNYSLIKMKYLVNKYIDLEQLKEFKNHLENSTGTSLTYYFKMKKPKQGTTTDNGPCLLNVVLTRLSRKSKWNRCFINYRTTEINRRFGADLILFSKFIEELPKCCEIEEIYLNLPKAYLNLRYLTTQIPWEYLDSEIDMHKKLLKEYHQMSDKGRKHSSYKSKCKIERILRGEEKADKVDISDFKILEKEK